MHNPDLLSTSRFSGLQLMIVCFCEKGLVSWSTRLGRVMQYVQSTYLSGLRLSIIPDLGVILA
jgi:hypothetical protein